MFKVYVFVMTAVLIWLVTSSYIFISGITVLKLVIFCLVVGTALSLVRSRK